MKGVPVVYQSNTTAGAVINAANAGTKRYRAVKSGADEALEEDGSEDEDDDEEILAYARAHRVIF